MTSYLDIDLLVNGGMDGLLLALTGRILRLPWQGKRLAAGVAIGEIPLLLAVYGPPQSLLAAKILVPALMVLVTFGRCRWTTWGKALVSFWLLAAGLGGLVYAIWGVFRFNGLNPSDIPPSPLILLPAAGAWWGGYQVWLKWQERATWLHKTVYNLEIDFGQPGQTVKVKALLDTGNQLKDPISGTPVLVIEEQAATAAIPDNLVAVIKDSWREISDPWPRLWQSAPELMRDLVFIPFQTIDHRSWLPGIRPQSVHCYEGTRVWTITATVALTRQVLSAEGEYQALLQPEHLKNRGD